MVFLSQKNISNQENIPILCESTILHDHDNSRFALGIFGADDVLGYEKTNNSLIKGYLQFRADVYIDHANILGAEARRPDGTELDEYDERSIHFVTFERRLGGVAVVASTRLIMKTNEDDLLPIELAFKDKIASPVSVGGVEVSRFIINHSESVHQRRIKTKMIMAELAFVMANDFGPAVGMVEKRFQRSLAAFGVVTKVLAGPISVEEGGRYGEGTHTTELMAVEILSDPLKKLFKEESTNKAPMGVGDFIYWGEANEPYKMELEYGKI